MCSTMLTICAGAAAHAQTMEVPVPPVRLALDERGANLATGGYQLQTNAVAIGTNDTGMAFSLTKSGLVWTQPWRYAVYYVTGGVEVVVGTTTLNFNLVSGAYVNQQATGETLTANPSGTAYTLTMRDGTIIYFDGSGGDPNAVAFHFYNKRAIAAANYILKPDGEKLTFRYKSLSYEGLQGWTSSLRVRSVTSSKGYMTKIEYVGSVFDNNWQKVAKVTLLNLGVDYCDPDADSCTGLTQTWPSMTFGESVAGAVTTRTETDTLGRVTTYTFDTTLRTTAIKRPSSATDNLVATSDATGKISSITANGVNWTYSWSLAAPNMTATITDPNGGQRVYVTDTTTKRVTSFRDELNRTTSYA